ncbi:MAG: hypothetical protein Tsb005_15740 [Gammaproteobacteria bacterium]
MHIIGCLLIIVGSLFVLISCIGLLRLPDVLTKMHATAKAATLGSGSILLGIAMQVASIHTVTTILLLIVFITLTNPIAAQLIGNAISQTHLNSDSH